MFLELLFDYDVAMNMIGAVLCTIIQWKIMHFGSQLFIAFFAFTRTYLFLFLRMSIFFVIVILLFAALSGTFMFGSR